MQVIAGLFELLSVGKEFFEYARLYKSSITHKSTRMAEPKEENIQQRGVSAQYGKSFLSSQKQGICRTQIGILGLDWLISKSDHSNAII